MVTAYSPILKLALPVQGELSGTWGDVVNDNITSMVEQAIAGRAVIDTWTTNSHVLTTANGTTSESRCAMLEFTDTGTALSGAGTVTCPTLSKIYIAKNASGQNVTLKTSGGTGILVPNGRTMFLFCDGTNVVEAVTSTTSLQLGTSTIVTAVLDEDNMASDSATSLATQQSIKAYVDSQVGANNELSEVLANGNTSGANDIIMTSGQKITTNTIDETTAASGVTIDSVLLKDDGVNATNLEITNIKANDGTAAGSIADSTGVVTVLSSILTTADINGGTADGVIIGGTTPAAATVTNLIANTDLIIAGTTTITAVLDEDNMASDSAAALATQQSIKAYVDSQVGTVDTLAEILAIGNTTGGTDIVASTTDKVQFRDAAIYINSSVDGQLDIVADTEIQIAATTVDLNGNLDVSGTALVTGVLTTTAATVHTGGITMPDNASAYFGASNDLQIVHNGSHSYIADSGTGNLYIQTSTGLIVQNSTGTETMATFTENGDVKLYYDNNLKLATTATGIDVTGTVTATGTFTGTSATLTTADNTTQLTLKSTDDDLNSGPELDFYRLSASPADNDYLGRVKYIGRNDNAQDVTAVDILARMVDVSDGTEDATYNIRVMKAGTIIERVTLNETETILNEAGADLDFRVESDTVTHALFVQGSDGNVGIGTSSPSAKVMSNVNTFTDADKIAFKGYNNQAVGVYANFQNATTGTGFADGFRLGIDDSENAQIMNGENTAMTFATSATERMRIDSSGDVGIGTSSPATKLHLATAINTGLLVSSTDGTTFKGIAFNTSDNQFTVGTQTNHPIVLFTNNTERMRIDSSGNVGIGTSSPSGNLQIVTATAGTVLNVNHDTGGTYPKASGIGLGATSTSLSVSSDGSTVLFTGGAGLYAENTAASGNPTNLVFWTNLAGTPAEVMRIDSSGNVGIGTTSPNAKLDIVATTNTIRLGRSTSSYATIDSNSSAGSLNLNADAGNTAGGGSMTFNFVGSEKMRIDSSGNVGIGMTPTNFGNGYTVLQVANASNGGMLYLTNTVNAGGRIYGNGAGLTYDAFSTTYHAFNTNGSERARITSDGRLFLNQTAQFGNTPQRMGLKFDGDTEYGIHLATTSNTGSAINFANAAGTQIGRISVSASATGYITSSDYRLKTDVQPMSGASDRVLALKPVNFAWIVSGDRVDGFLAHETQEVVPEAIDGTKDAMCDEEYEVTAAIAATYDEDGNELTAAVEAVMGTRSVPYYQGIDQSKLVPLLTAALQEALTKIADMEIRLSALEG
jgi:hypothetical protein